jgi:iron complex transport system substrate-binding protein
MPPTPSRRRLLQGLAVSAFGSIAGCAAGSLGDQSGTSTENSSSTNDSTGTESGSYSVTMEPMGTVTFEEVPTKWLAGHGDWADMGLALGRDPPAGMWYLSHYRSQPYYEEIPGVSVDRSEITNLTGGGGGFSPEAFYEIAADVHVMDPNFLLTRFKGFERTNIKRIRKSVAPFFANAIYSHAFSWHDYRYYTLYEAFGKLAQVFQQQERYRMFVKLHEEMQQTIEANLPTGEHPAVALLWPMPANKPDEYLPYYITKATSTKQWHDLEVRDALAKAGVAGESSGPASWGGVIDSETLLEVDPDVLLLHNHERKTAKQFQNTVVEYLENQPVTSELTAVKKGNVFRAGSIFQGPIINLVLTERAANQVYPDAFDGVNLYDPQRVADIVNGKV